MAVVIAIVVGVWWVRGRDRASPAGRAAPAPTSPWLAPATTRPRPVPAAPGLVPRLDPGEPTVDDGGEVAPARPVEATTEGELALMREPAPTKETEPSLVSPPPVRPLAELKDEAVGRVREATRPCLRADEAAIASGQALRLRYTLVLEDGRGRFEGVAIVESDLVDPGLGECIVGTIGDLEWPVVDAPGGRLAVHDAIRLSDLRTRD